jgi:hypothetical protein
MKCVKVEIYVVEGGTDNTVAAENVSREVPHFVFHNF